jgi:copper chaperone NosL
MRKQNVKHLVALFLLVCSAAVSSGAAEKPKPAFCKQCNMKIVDSEKKYAVYVLEGLEPTAFNDIGCAVIWYNNECAMRQSAFDSNAVAHDFITEEPVPMEKAVYVTGPGVKTPKGYGIVAFKNREQAEKFAGGPGNGNVISYNELTALKLK